MHFEARRWSSLRNQSMTFNRETRITQVREFTRLRLIRLFRTHDCEETHTAPRAFIEFSINTVHELNSFRISSVRMSCARERQKKKVFERWKEERLIVPIILRYIVPKLRSISNSKINGTHLIAPIIDLSYRN